MTPAAAHVLLALMPDRPRLMVAADDTLTLDFWPANMVALASLSGWLSDAVTLQDLEEAAQHGSSLVSSGVFKRKRLNRELEEVVAEIGAASRAELPGDD